MARELQFPCGGQKASELEDGDINCAGCWFIVERESTDYPEVKPIWCPFGNSETDDDGKTVYNPVRCQWAKPNEVETGGR